MSHNCVIDIYHILVKQWQTYDKNHIVHAHLDKILSKMHKYANISHKSQFDTISNHETTVHLMNMSM